MEYALDLFSHQFILDELEEHSEELCELLRVSKEKFRRIQEILAQLVNLKVKVSPQHLHWARSLISDPDDNPVFSLGS